MEDHFPRPIRTLEYTVMPLGLTNAPTLFQYMANDIFRDFLDSFTIRFEPFTWNISAIRAFENLKKEFTSAPILMHADLSKPFIIEVDASALESILPQSGDDGKLHPIVLHSYKFKAIEIYYEIHDKELLARVDSFEQWCHLLKGSPYQIIIYNDHKNLTYFKTARV